MQRNDAAKRFITVFKVPDASWNINIHLSWIEDGVSQYGVTINNYCTLDEVIINFSRHINKILSPPILNNLYAISLYFYLNKIYSILRYLYHLYLLSLAASVP